MLGIARGECKPMSDVSPFRGTLWRRLVALVYDGLIVVALVMVVGLGAQLATGGRLITTGAQVHVPAWYQLLQAGVVAAYFIASWRRGGQTIGMRPWRIRVCRADGSAISLRQAVIRLAVAGAPLLALVIEPFIGPRADAWLLAALWGAWFTCALVDARGRALHDLLAGSEVHRC